jgi:predicted nuclease of predicted toxin-antitoxin system
MDDLNEWKEVKYQLSGKVIPRPKKIKLIADQNVPQELIDDLKEHGIAIISIREVGFTGHPDEHIREIAKKKNRVLLTTDKDFWDEKKHPIHKCFGMIISEAGPQEYDKLIYSLAKLYVNFMKDFSHDLWANVKAYIKPNSFNIRQLTAEGRISEKEYKIERGTIMERIIR